MAKRMLVPLDQTVDSASILPLVADAARGGGAAIRLLHVAPVPGNVLSADGRTVAYADQEMARLEAEALDYLHTEGARLDGLPVEVVVRFGEPVTEILAEIEGFEADLVAMTTRRRPQISRLVLGSTAEEVCRRAEIPVMVYRPGVPGR